MGNGGPREPIRYTREISLGTVISLATLVVTTLALGGAITASHYAVRADAIAAREAAAELKAEMRLRKPVIDKVLQLDARMGLLEAQVADIAALRATISRLDERSVRQGDTLDRLERKIEDALGIRKGVQR